MPATRWPLRFKLQSSALFPLPTASQLRPHQRLRWSRVDFLEGQWVVTATGNETSKPSSVGKAKRETKARSCTPKRRANALETMRLPSRRMRLGSRMRLEGGHSSLLLLLMPFYSLSSHQRLSSTGANRLAMASPSS
jgi:hypothetical protein